MEKERPDEQTPPRFGGAGETDGGAPTIVLPSPNTQGVTGDLQGTASTVAPILPQPFISSLNAAGDDLAARVEDALAEDGRFTAFVPRLGISAAGGTVRLAGTVPSEGQRQSLLSAVRAIHGVTDVQDDLTTS